MKFKKEKEICEIFSELCENIPSEISIIDGLNLWHLSRRKIFYKYRANCFQNQFKFSLNQEKQNI